VELEDEGDSSTLGGGVPNVGDVNMLMGDVLLAGSSDRLITIGIGGRDGNRSGSGRV
jgi:hypothetical protein